MKTDQQISEMTNEERNRAVAEEVMGWEQRDFVSDSTKHFFQSDPNDWIIYGGRRWSPSTSPTDDYAVLVHVRENWDECKARLFFRELERIWQIRWCDMPQDELKAGWVSFLLYQPGDYARAALETVREHDREDNPE